MSTKTRVTVDLDIFEIGVLLGLMTHLNKDDNSIAIHMRHRFIDIAQAYYLAEQEAIRKDNEARVAEEHP